MKKKILILLLCFTSFSIFAQAKLELYKDMLTTDNLRLRSIENGNNQVLCVLSKGTRVTIIDIKQKETIDGITSNWVFVEVKKDAKDKDGNPVKYGMIGKCFGAYLKNASPVSYDPNYGNGNGTITERTEDKDFYITKRKYQLKLKVGEMAGVCNIYKDLNKTQLLTTIKLNDYVDVEEYWEVQSKKDSQKYAFFKVTYNGIKGFLHISNVYENNKWEILEKIKIKNKTWTVRKLYQDLSVFSNDEYVEIRDNPGFVNTKVISKIPASYTEGRGQVNIKIEAATEECDPSDSIYRWVKITHEGKTGWIYSKFLSAERGGPTFLIPEHVIDFEFSDAP